MFLDFIRARSRSLVIGQALACRCTEKRSGFASDVVRCASPFFLTFLLILCLLKVTAVAQVASLRSSAFRVYSTFMVWAWVRSPRLRRKMPPAHCVPFYVSASFHQLLALPLIYVLVRRRIPGLHHWRLIFSFADVRCEGLPTALVSCCVFDGYASRLPLSSCCRVREELFTVAGVRHRVRLRCILLLFCFPCVLCSRPPPISLSSRSLQKSTCSAQT